MDRLGADEALAFVGAGTASLDDETGLLLPRLVGFEGGALVGSGPTQPDKTSLISAGFFDVDRLEERFGGSSKLLESWVTGSCGKAPGSSLPRLELDR